MSHRMSRSRRTTPAGDSFNPLAPRLSRISLAAAVALSAVAPEAAGADPVPSQFVLPGANPLVFHVDPTAARRTKDGWEVTGKPVTLELPGGKGQLLDDAQLLFETNAQGGVTAVTGTVKMPVILGGALAGMSVRDPPQMSLTVESGKEYGAAHKQFPLAPERNYLALHPLDGGFPNLGFGPVTLGKGTDNMLQILFDPTDPELLLYTSMTGFFAPLTNVGVGISASGTIPFVPSTTDGTRPIAGFSGQVYIAGTVPVRKIIQVEGQSVINIDPDHRGTTLATLKPNGDFNLGANGRIYLSVPLVGAAAGLQLTLGTGSLSAAVRGERINAAFAGIEDPAQFKPAKLPAAFVPPGALTVSGSFDTGDLSKSYVKASGKYNWGIPDYSKIVPGAPVLELNASMTGDFVASEKGVAVSGTADRSLVAAVPFKSEIKMEGSFSFNRPDFLIAQTGETEIAGMRLVDTRLEITHKGAMVKGSFRTPLTQILMSGAINNRGVDLTGTAKLDVPIQLQAGSEVVQAVANGAVCGSHDVADAGMCGTDIVTDAGRCGTRQVADAAVCGVSFVHDGDRCGVDWVTDGARCGFSTIRDGARCGFDFLGSLFHGKKPKSCKVANRCAVPRGCNVPKSCSTANTCHVAKTCHIPNTCPQKVKIPAPVGGTIKGDLTLKMGPAGAGGQVKARFCRSSNDCIDLPQGRVELSAKPQVCLSGVPGLGSEFCLPF